MIPLIVVCRAGAWFLAFLVTALSLVPPVFRPESGTPHHHFEHFAIFCATGAAFGLGYSSNPRRLAAALVLFAGAIEFAQIFAPGRHARLTDFIVDALAACVGVALSALATEASAYWKAIAPQLFMFQQKICQGFDQAFGVWFHWCLRNLAFQLENELRSIVMPVCPHDPSPSRSKDWIVRSASDSRRRIRERWQAR